MMMTVLEKGDVEFYYDFCGNRIKGDNRQVFSDFSYHQKQDDLTKLREDFQCSLINLDFIVTFFIEINVNRIFTWRCNHALLVFS